MVSIDFDLSLCGVFAVLICSKARGVPLSWTTSPRPMGTNSATPLATSGQWPQFHLTNYEGEKSTAVETSTSVGIER
jgi:hypothetical protein